MTPERIDDETLAAYLDGELCPADAERVRTAIESDRALEAEVARHVRLGDVVRASDPELEARLGSQRDSDDLFDRIEQAIERPAGARPVEQAPTASKPAPVVPLRASRTRVVAVATTVVLAAAAALFVVFRPVRPPRRESVASAPSLTDVPRGSEILDVDFGKSTGTTFSVEGTHGEPLAVVWISDSELALK